MTDTTSVFPRASIAEGRGMNDRLVGLAAGDVELSRRVLSYLIGYGAFGGAQARAGAITASARDRRRWTQPEPWRCPPPRRAAMALG